MYMCTYALERLYLGRYLVLLLFFILVCGYYSCLAFICSLFTSILVPMFNFYCFYAAGLCTYEFMFGLFMFLAHINDSVLRICVFAFVL